MKISREATVLSDGTVESAHTIEQICAHCKDPVSEEEQTTGVCTNCGEPWQAIQNVSVVVTSLPPIQGLTINVG